MISVVTLPLITSLAIGYYDRGDEVELPFVEVVKVFAIVLVPVAIGMAGPAPVARRSRPGWTSRCASLGGHPGGARARPSCWASARTSRDYFADVGAVAGLFCAASLVVGYVVPKALGITDAQAIASSMEIGVHNATLAIFVAVEVLDEVEISVPAAVYSLFMFVLAAVWGAFVSRRVGARETAGTSA